MTAHAEHERCRWCGQRLVVFALNWDKRVHANTGQMECEGSGKGHMAEPIPTLHENDLRQAVKEFIGHHQHLRRALREAHQARASAVRRMKDHQRMADAVIAAYDELHRGADAEERLAAAIATLREYRADDYGHVDDP